MQPAALILVIVAIFIRLPCYGVRVSQPSIRWVMRVSEPVRCGIQVAVVAVSGEQVAECVGSGCGMGIMWTDVAQVVCEKW